MTCPIHTTKAGDGPDPGGKRPVEEQGITQRFIGEFLNIVSAYYDSLVSALEEGAIDPAAGNLSLQLRDMFDSQRPKFVTTFRQHRESAYSTGREAAIRQQELDISFEVEHPEVEDQLIRNAERAAEETELTIVGNLAEVLVEANRRGLGIYADEQTGEPGITDLLQEQVFSNAEDWHAELVARSTVIPASNYGAYKAYEDAGAPGKRWLATGPPYNRTRESHEEADGQVVPLGEPFITGAGNEARYPGDPQLPLADRLQCRCAVAAAFDI